VTPTGGTPPEYLAFGDLGVDSIARVDHLPRVDDKIWVEPAGNFPGGMMGNCVATAAALGVSAGVVALVGDDTRGQLILDALASRGVDTSYVRVVDDPTFWTLSLTLPSGDRTLLQFPTSAFGADWEGFDSASLAGVRWVHTVAEQGDPVEALLRAAKNAGASTSLDIEFPYVNRPDLPDLMPWVDVAFCNSAAATALGGPQETARRLRDLGADRVVVTRGQDGALVCDLDGRTRAYAIRHVKTVDTNGAGDAFAAAFAAGMLRGFNTDEAAELAVFMSAESTTVYGGFGPRTTLDELRDKAADAGYDWGARL
jgi:ribokinase